MNVETQIRWAKRAGSVLIVLAMLVLGLNAGQFFWAKAHNAENDAKRYRNVEVDPKTLSDQPDGPVTFRGSLDGDGLTVGYLEAYERHWVCYRRSRSINGKDETYQDCGNEWSWERKLSLAPPISMNGKVVASTGYAMLTANSETNGDIRWTGFRGGDTITVMAEMGGGKARAVAVCKEGPEECALEYEKSAGAGFYLMGIFSAFFIWCAALLLGFWLFVKVI